VNKDVYKKLMYHTKIACSTWLHDFTTMLQLQPQHSG